MYCAGNFSGLVEKVHAVLTINVSTFNPLKFLGLVTPDAVVGNVKA
jgi:hypothetical protein